MIALCGSMNMTVKMKVDNNCVQTSRSNLRLSVRVYLHKYQVVHPDN